MASIDEMLPGHEAFAVTKSDATTYDPPFRAIYVGGAGNLALVCNKNGAAVTFTGVLAGTILPVNAYKVMSTNTTATALVGIY